MTVYKCPVNCGKSSFSTANGAVMHAINKEDDQHADIDDKASAYALLDGENPEAAEELEESTEDLSESTPEATTGPEFPEAPDGPNTDPLTPDEPLETEEPEETEADDGDDEPEPDTEATASAAPAVLLVLAVGGLALLLGSRGGSQTEAGPDYGVV